MINKFRKLINPLLALLLAGAILLMSDFSNRKGGNKKDDSIYKIAIIHWLHAPITEKIDSGILQGLADNQLIKNRSIAITSFNASADISLLSSIFNQVINLRPDLIFISCTPVLQKAVNVVKDIPVIYTAVADPVLAGAGKDVMNHSENITGINVTCDFETMCSLISECAPGIKTLGSLFCPGEIISVKFKDEFTRIASRRGLQVKFFPANNASDLPDAVLSMVNSNIDAVCQMGDNLLSSCISTLIKGVVDANLPYFEFNQRPPDSSMEALIEIDIDYFQNGYDAALLAADILLNNISPGNIPFQNPSQPFILINPAKAQQFGIEFSEKIIQNAMIYEP
jgi:ABC-type uncharacterized transport system substrate-binding protein